MAIVGARLCSAYGRHFAVKIAEELAGYDISLVSGMARGIDGTAQRAAIKGGGKSYAVLGCGPDICYPMQNRDLYQNLLKNGGVLSEYPPGSSPLPFHFPMRNRIISGLSDLVIVIEAREKKRITHHSRSGTGTGQRCYGVAGQSRRCTQCRMQPPDRPGSRHFSLHRSDPGTS